MLASTLKLRPRYFLMVLALAGDSTITRLVFPLATGALFSGAGALEVRAEDGREVARVVLPAVFEVVFLRVVALVLFVVVVILALSIPF